MLRLALLFGIILLIFLLFNIALVRIHPRCKWTVALLAVFGNAMWIFFPWLNARTDFARALVPLDVLAFPESHKRGPVMLGLRGNVKTRTSRAFRDAEYRKLIQSLR